ncbi:MAG: 3,4-dihydroxy-2-butanone-4-phosphate synthase [Planctomycetota bacterium]|nr:3,4-dihydroxy-2-butanone-4-phosphate synthase [Planctomycetota bacterium]
MAFAPVEQLIEEISRGGMVILVDDEHRENEGDLIIAAEKITAEKITFLAKEGRGLICAPLSAEIIDRLQLPAMTNQPSDPDECAFYLSVDAREGTTTGISAHDRARTARLLADPSTQLEAFKRPGHLFPLRAHPEGVLARTGHTEASVDLTRLAGLQPAAVICEVMNDDGSMARLPDLIRFAQRHQLLLGTIESLVEYRQKQESSTQSGRREHLEPRCHSAAQLPTPFGIFEIECWSVGDGEPITLLRQGDLSSAGGDPPVVRVHSACFTGDVIGSLRCDCGAQLQMALDTIGFHERGALLYLPQEGRGIGLTSKIEAYHLQQNEGLDTVEANERLGYPPDLRDYTDAAKILKTLGATEIQLLTNNPSKVNGLQQNGIEVVKRLAIEAGSGPVNLNYLQVKKTKLGHIFEAI